MSGSVDFKGISDSDILKINEKNHELVYIVNHIKHQDSGFWPFLGGVEDVGNCFFDFNRSATQFTALPK